MKTVYHILLVLQCLKEVSQVSGFILPLTACLRPYKQHSISMYQDNHGKSENTTKTNTTKIMKLNFVEETDEEKLFKARYSFGLSEFDMILLRIYVYMVITIYFVRIYIEEIQKMITYQ